MQAQDFEAIEDDVLYVIHQKTVCKEVYENLIILARVLKNADDKVLRSRYREIERVKGRMYPLERDYTIAESKGQDEPTMIIGID